MKFFSNLSFPSIDIDVVNNNESNRKPICKMLWLAVFIVWRNNRNEDKQKVSQKNDKIIIIAYIVE